MSDEIAFAHQRQFDLMYRLSNNNELSFQLVYESPCSGFDLKMLSDPLYWPDTKNSLYFVYEIWASGWAEYVGYTNQPKRRIQDHYENWMWELLQHECSLYLGLVIFDTIEEAISEETERIALCDPVRNIIRPVY